MIRKEVDALTLARDVGYVPELWKEDTVLFTSMSGPTVLVTLRNEVAVDAKVDMAGSPITDDSDWILAYSHKVAAACHMAKAIIGRRVSKKDMPTGE